MEATLSPEPVNLLQHFHPGGIVEISATNKDAALAELCSVTESHPHVLDSEAFRRAIFERERLVSTGIGIGIAIPHVKIPEVSDYVISVGRSKPGIDFDALDNKPVHLIFMIAASDKQSREFVKVLAAIVRLVKLPEMQERLMAAEIPEEFLAVIEGACA